MTNEEAIDRLRLDIDMVQFDPNTGRDKYLTDDEITLIEAQRLGMKALASLRVGKWKVKTRIWDSGEILECPFCESNFDHEHLVRNSYCPNCGARMEGQE